MHADQVTSMVASPPVGTSSSAPVTQDEFNAVVQSTYGRYPLTIVRGDGCKLFDSNGKVSMHPSIHPQVLNIVGGKYHQRLLPV